MKTRTIEISVGLFVILAIGALLMLAMQVSGLSDFYRDENGYKVTAHFANVGSLKQRSKVTMAGVKIGRVTKVDLDQQEFIAVVELSIDDEFKNIPRDSEARINTAGLLGDNYIAIQPGFDEEFLKDGDIIDETKTNSAVVLEDLISKFLAGEATNGR